MATFVAPLGTLLVRSAYDPLVADALPETLALLRTWDGASALEEPVYATAARELLQAREERTLGQIATRVNRIKSGLRSVVTRSARPVCANASGDSWRETMIGIDDAWGRPDVWLAIRSAGERFTFRHYINALDLMRQPDGSIARQPEERRIYRPLLWRTLAISLGIFRAVLGHWLPDCPPDRPRGRRAAPTCCCCWCWCRFGHPCW